MGTYHCHLSYRVANVRRSSQKCGASVCFPVVVSATANAASWMVLRLQLFISSLVSRQHLRMSQPLPPVAPKAMMASSAFSVLNGSAQSPAFPSGIPKGPKASHHSHGKAGGAKANGGAAAAQGVNAVHTHTAMGRWSILPKEPPSKSGLHHLSG